MAKVDIQEVINDMRMLEKWHGPDEWLRVPLNYITSLCDAVEKAIPALGLLQTRLEHGAYIACDGNRWWLFDESGEGLCRGNTIRGMLIDLISVDG